MNFQDRFLFSTMRGDCFFLPTFGIIDTDARGGWLTPYRFRIAFGWLCWRASIGLGQKRPRKRERL